MTRALETELSKLLPEPQLNFVKSQISCAMVSADFDLLNKRIIKNLLVKFTCYATMLESFSCIKSNFYLLMQSNSKQCKKRLKLFLPVLLKLSLEYLNAGAKPQKILKAM